MKGRISSIYNTIHNLRTLSDATVASGLTSSPVRHVVIADCMHLDCHK
jgi:hypothetical protein